MNRGMWSACRDAAAPLHVTKAFAPSLAPVNHGAGWRGAANAETLYGPRRPYVESVT